MGRWWVVLLVLALPLAGAGTPEEPEVVDDPGDAPAQWDVLGAWFQPRLSVMDVGVQLAQLDPSAPVSVDVMWREVPLFDPAAASDGSGIRIAYQAGQAAWAPLGAPLVAGVGTGAVDVDTTQGYLIARDVESQRLQPILRDLRVVVHESVAALSDQDEATSPAWVNFTGPVLLGAVEIPAYAPTLSGGDGAVPAAADLQRAWLRLHDDGFDLTLEARSLTPESMQECPRWNAFFFLIEQEDHRQTASLYHTIDSEAGDVRSVYLNSDLDETAEAGQERPEPRPLNVTWRIETGTPGLVHYEARGQAWQASDDPADHYRSVRLSCVFGDDEWEIRLAASPGSVFAGLGAPPTGALAVMAPFVILGLGLVVTSVVMLVRLVRGKA